MIFNLPYFQVGLEVTPAYPPFSSIFHSYDQVPDVSYPNSHTTTSDLQNCALAWVSPSTSAPRMVHTKIAGIYGKLSTQHVVFHRCWSIATVTGIQFLHDFVIFLPTRTGILVTNMKISSATWDFTSKAWEFMSGQIDWLIWPSNKHKNLTSQELGQLLKIEIRWQTMESYQHKNGRTEYKQNMDRTSDAHQFSAIWGGNWGMSWSPDIRVGSTSSSASSKPIYQYISTTIRSSGWNMFGTTRQHQTATFLHHINRQSNVGFRQLVPGPSNPPWRSSEDLAPAVVKK